MLPVGDLAALHPTDDADVEAIAHTLRAFDVAELPFNWIRLSPSMRKGFCLADVERLERLGRVRVERRVIGHVEWRGAKRTWTQLIVSLPPDAQT
jgi:hypothetical protein